MAVAVGEYTAGARVLSGQWQLCVGHTGSRHTEVSPVSVAGAQGPAGVHLGHSPDGIHGRCIRSGLFLWRILRVQGELHASLVLALVNPGWGMLGT